MTSSTGIAADDSVVAPDVMLRVEDLNKRFGGVKAVDDVSFEVARGEIAALIGPNGAGKTTTFNLLTGFVRSDSGRVMFDGKDISGRPPHKLAALGLVRTFQTARMFPSMTVREIIATGAMLKQGRRGATTTAAEVMGRLGIESLHDSSGSDRSLPDRQLVELAKCLAMRPRMILLDEIMGGLNRTECAGPVQAIRDLSAEGMTFLLVEHVMPIVMSLARHIIVLDFGRRIATGTPNFWADFLSLMKVGSNDLFHDQEDRSRWPAMKARLAAIFAAHPRNHWAEVFEAGRACVTPVLSMSESATAPENIARATFSPMPGGGYWPSPAPRFSHTPTGAPSPAPTPGEHTAAVLAERVNLARRTECAEPTAGEERGGS